MKKDFECCPECMLTGRISYLEITEISGSFFYRCPICGSSFSELELAEIFSGEAGNPDYP